MNIKGIKKIEANKNNGNDSMCLSLAHHFSTLQCNVLGLFAIHEECRCLPFCVELAKSIKHFANKSTMVVVENDDTKDNETKGNHTTSQNYKTPSFVDIRPVNIRDPSVFYTLKHTIEAQEKTAQTTLIDLTPFYNMGEHLAVSKLCDEILFLVTKSKVHEFSIKKFCKEFYLAKSPKAIIIES